MNFELMAMIWLRTEKRCEIVLRERSPRSWQCGQPDVLGITPSRYMIEIEVKRSVSDFRRDKHKACRRNRTLFPDMQPRQFYYFCPTNVAEVIKDELPDWAGLMDVSDRGLQPFVLKKAPINNHSRRLSVKECCRLVPMLTNHILSSESSRDCLIHSFIEGFDPYLWSGVNHYEI